MKLKQLIHATAFVLAFAMPAFAEEETPLEKEMEKINKTLKAIDRAAKEGAVKKDMAAKVEDAKKAAEASLKLEPAKTKDIPAGEKEKFLADYKAAMEKTIKSLDALKAAVESENAAEVSKVLDTLKAEKKDGHKKFQKDE